MQSKMFNRLNIPVFILAASIFCGCSEMTSNSSPRLSGDYSKLLDEIEAMSNAQSVSLEDFETKRRDHVVKRELRIDLTTPNPFPDGMKIKEIIIAVKSKLIDSAKFDRYTVTEVPRQEGSITVKPAQKILKSVTIMANDL